MFLFYKHLSLLWLLLASTTTALSSTSSFRRGDFGVKEEKKGSLQREDSSYDSDVDNKEPILHDGSLDQNVRLESFLRRVLRTAENDDKGDSHDNDEESLYIPKCGEILATMRTQELRDLLEQMLVDHLDLTEEELFVLRVGVLPEVDYGIQVIKVCGKCSDYTGLYPGVCEASHYAVDVLHSGLAMIPLQRDSTRMVRGTRPVTILCHGTQASNLAVPSNLWNVTNSTTPDGLVLFGTLFTSMTATISILPDYTGYGETRNTAFRAYIVRQGYATATLPLYWELQKYLQETQDCKTAAATSFAVVGYSEGGFAAVALADVLQNQLGYDVIQVRAGGAPLQLSTEQLKFLVEQVMTDTFDPKRRYYVALLAATFSTTTTDVDNYNKHQDLVDAAQRSTILAAIRKNGNDRGAINQVIPYQDPLSILDANKSATFQQAITAGEVDPCVTSVVPGETDLLCQALQAQDLLETVLSAPYDIVLCHSPDDSLVTFANMPTPEQVSTNPHLDLELVEGDHQPAALECFLQSLLWFVKKMENYKVAQELHSKEGCNVTDNDEDLMAGYSKSRAHDRWMGLTTVWIMGIGAIAGLLIAWV